MDFYSAKEYSAMGRSERKTPIYGICGGSEKEDRRIWHRRFRRKGVALLKQHDEHISTDHWGYLIHGQCLKTARCIGLKLINNDSETNTHLRCTNHGFINSNDRSLHNSSKTVTPINSAHIHQRQLLQVPPHTKYSHAVHPLLRPHSGSCIQPHQWMLLRHQWET